MPRCSDCGATLDGAEEECPICGLSSGHSAADSEPIGTTSEILYGEVLQRDLAESLAPQYELRKVIATGGMGAVFLANEPALKRLVAVKALSPKLAVFQEARTRFTREARAAAKLSHPNVIRVYAVGETKGLQVPYIVMQYVEGKSLEDWMGERKQVSERHARQIIGQVAAALDAAHDHALVHRDVKPANILIEAESGRPYVVDFGITAALSTDDAEAATDLTAPGAVIGTVIYMSPEQAVADAVGPKSDVYSLGMVAYELLAGELPFDASGKLGWVAAHLRVFPAPLGEVRPDVSPELAHLVDRCLAKEPENRPDAGEIARGMLPSIEWEIEWPPPGLQSLQGLARRFIAIGSVASVAGLLMSIGLTIPPGGVPLVGEWWEVFAAAFSGSSSVLGVRPESYGAVSPALAALSRAALVFGLVCLAISALSLLVLGVQAIRSFHRNRVIGWPWRTITDVAADPDGRSGLMIGGTGEFASLPVDHRQAVLKARRLLAGVLVGTALWVPAALCTWGLLVMTGVLKRGGVGALFGVSAWAFVLAPALAAMLAAAVAGIRERRAVAPLNRRRAHTSTMTLSRAKANQHDVHSWYATLPDGEEPVARPGTATWIAPTAFSLLLLLVTVGGVAALAGMSIATLVADRVVRNIGPPTYAVAVSLRQLDRTDPFTVAEDLWRSYTPPQEKLSDSIVREWIRSLYREPGSHQAPPSYAIGPSDLVPDGRIANMIRAAFDGLSTDTLGLLPHFNTHPRTQLLRSIAGALHADLLAAALDRPPSAYPGWDSLPPIPYKRLSEAASANALAGVLLVSQSDLDGAARLLGMNGAVATHLLKAPAAIANQLGVGLLQNLSLFPLAQVEDLRSRQTRATELREAAHGVREYVLSSVWGPGLNGLAADPSDMTKLVGIMKDARLPGSIRLRDAFRGALVGFCSNPREIIAGEDGGRIGILAVAADSMPDVPYARELAQLTIDSWTQDKLASSTEASSLLDRLLGWYPGDFARRLRFCNQSR